MIILLRLFEYKNFVNLVVKDKSFSKGSDLSVFIFPTFFLFSMSSSTLSTGEILIQIINPFTRNPGPRSHKLCGSLKTFGDDISWVEFSRYVTPLFRFTKESDATHVIAHLVIKSFRLS